VHIPDGFLSPAVAATTAVAAAGAIGLALRAETRERTPMPAGVLGSLAAFLFAAQMVNVPVAPGTSGHLVGATLAAVLVGPWRGLLALTAVLLVQALLFQDGGITALGANVLDMGVAATFAGYATGLFVSARVRGLRGYVAGGVLGAFVATVAGAALASVWLAASGMYPLAGILPVMLVTHVAIGLLEAALTGAVLVTLATWRPDLLAGFDRTARAARPTAIALGALGIALAVAAFLAPFASALPDGLERTAETLGFAGRAGSIWSAPMPDYTAPLGRFPALATTVAGSTGTLAAAALAWAISRTLALRDGAAHRPPDHS
jgi:cobalt/nickel transport system permease protein